MSLKVGKFPPHPKHLLQCEHGKAFHARQAAHSPKHVFNKAECVACLSAVLLLLLFICIH
jgi:hypothetical protein